MDSQRAFVVHYSEDGDRELNDHFDNAEITLNVALSDQHEDGELVFNGLNSDPVDPSKMFGYEHVMGRGVLHRGRHVHSALPIRSGERWNLIIWMRSSVQRNHLCPLCCKAPQLIPAPEYSYGDGFTLK